VCCSMLQCVSECCKMLEYVAVCCCMIQRVAVCFSKNISSRVKTKGRWQSNQLLSAKPLHFTKRSFQSKAQITKGFGLCRSVLRVESFFLFLSFSFFALFVSNHTYMGWPRFVGSFKLQVSFAEYSLFYRALLHKRDQ